MAQKKEKLKIIPLGGLGEIGKNMTVFEYGKDIMLIDSGLAFPEDEMLGIDIVIPDITYLEKNRDKIKGLFLTHGHEDHIGSIPYLLKKINVPIYGTGLTIGLVEKKILEHGLEDVELNVVEPGARIKAGVFTVEFIRSNHSIPDSVAFAIETPLGVVVHTGDFKIDYNPINGDVIDLNRLAQFGSKGVLVAMSDSTNVESKGYTESESTVGNTFTDVFRDCKSRIIVATFASNIHRIQQIVNAAVLYGRHVVLSGRSMLNVVEVAVKLGYLTVEEGLIIDIKDMKSYKDSELVLITTGSQGEPMSALTRMACNEHRKLNIKKGDTVIISANPIPGNEKTVSKVIDMLYQRGANVIYNALEDVHVTGHAKQEELKLMLTLLKPKFFMPVHGEFRHLRHHAELAQSMGIAPNRIVRAENGDIIEVTQKSIRVAGAVPSGAVLVDGLGVGDIGNMVLRDRKKLSENGLLIITLVFDCDNNMMLPSPEIYSRGFIYVKDNADFMDESKEIIKIIVNKCNEARVTDWSVIKNIIKDEMGNYVYDQFKRQPMVITMINTINNNKNS